MSATINRIARALLCLACTGATFLLPDLCGHRAAAQIFQYQYGGVCVERGYGGVQPVSTGGYIAAGSSWSPSNCASSDIYVMKANDDGTLAWSRTYSIGTSDSATDIRECGNGDFIVTGHTDTSNCGRRRDIFLMRLDASGVVLWVKVYGGGGTDEQAWSVLETARSGGNKTAPGDFVVAGVRNTTAGG